MVQTGESPELKITFKTIYSDSHTALTAYSVLNKTNKELPVRSVFNLAPYDSAGLNGRIFYDLNNAEMAVQFEKKYKAEGNTLLRSFTLKPHEQKTEYIAVSHRFKEEEPFADIDFENTGNIFRENTARWQAYLEPYASLSMPEQILAAKCVQTLVTNWRSAAGALLHDGLFPSYAYRGFNGFWAWDSWKHAVALASLEPELAKDQIRAMYDYQDGEGMIPDCIFRDTAIEAFNRRDTKPPLSGWAIYEVYRKTGDTAFVNEMLPQLIRYHEWWYENRDPDGNGLCAYGSTDGTRVAAAWESGMDNAVRFDSAKLIKVHAHAWAFDQESVDLNAYLYAEKKYISLLAGAVGRKETEKHYREQLEPLKEQIRQRFYDPENGYFYDYNTDKHKLVKVAGPEAWIVLWAGIADEKQAAGVVRKVMDTTCFNTFLPFPTLSAANPEFDPENGYWRGPVWLDQAYFALEGMKRYGYTDEYMLMKNKLLTHAEGLMEQGVPLRENYDSRDGSGLNAEHFSWTAAHLLLIVKEGE
jgi:putative isomerase